MIEQEEVIVVDASDRVVGAAPKLEAHVAGLLHRAVSVFITDGRGNLLLQRRADGKYHSPGLWTNSCCGHPRPGESPAQGARRRLEEEMGITCPLEYAGSFHYRAEFSNGLIEHEIDHVFVGRWSGQPTPDSSEVASWRWVPVSELQHDMQLWPLRYTAWLAPALATARGHALLGGGQESERAAG